MKRFVRATLVLSAALALAACGRGLTPSTSPPPPPPRIDPMPDARVPVVTAWSVGRSNATTRLRVATATSLRAVDVTTGDVASGAPAERRTAVAVVGYRRAVDSLGVAWDGSIDSLRVRATPAVAYAPPSVAERESLPPRRASARDSLVDVLTLPRTAFAARRVPPLQQVVARPPLANECEADTVAALDLARAVLIAWRDTLRVGDRWRDTTRSIVCRGGVATTVDVVSQWSVVGGAATAPDSLWRRLWAAAVSATPVPAAGDFPTAGPRDAFGAPLDTARITSLRRSDSTSVLLRVARTISVRGVREDRWQRRALTGDGTGEGLALLDVQRGELLAFVAVHDVPLRITERGVTPRRRSAADGAGSPRDEARTVHQEVTIRAVDDRLLARPR